MPINELQAIEKLNFFGFLWKHKLIFLFILFTLPIIISSISQAISEKNIIIPATQLGLAVLNSDHLIYDNVQILKNNPDDLIGMSHPQVGIYQHVKYYFKIFLLIWKFLGYIFMVIIPFSFSYWIFNLKNNSTKAKNIILSLVLGISFIFIINLLITIVNLANGSLTLTLRGNQFTQILQVIFLTMPFHGIISLVGYLIDLII